MHNSDSILNSINNGKANITYGLRIMAGQVQNFLASWEEFSIDDRKKSIAAFTKQSGHKTTSLKKSAATECPSTVYNGVQLSSHYSYIYYYPTMHWSLNRTPLDDTYWVGIFRKDASDDDYITYQWIEKAAQGSYKIGKLDTQAGMASKERFEEFELRIFRGNQRLKAESNTLRGMVNIAPINPVAPNESESLFEYIEPDAETTEFIKAIENPTNEFKRQFLDASQEKWESFGPQQRQLLLPILKQSIMPDEIAKPGPKYNKPEPKSVAGNERFQDEDEAGPDKIVLTITLDSAYTYVYPQVHVKKEISKRQAWMGMYYPQSDACFDPDSYIDNNWAWVGTGYTGSTTTLDDIEEYAEGPTNTMYLGAIFDDKEQLGFAASTIETAVFTTPALPPVPFEPEFNTEQALRYAELSTLAYEPYFELKTELFKFGLVPEMGFHDSGTDTSGFIASDDDSIVVAFRGTDSLVDLSVNINFKSENVDNDENYTAHEGFLKALDTVYDTIEDRIKPYIGQKRIIITGHSLGGALATLTTFRISHKYENTNLIQLFVYGCPPVGNINLSNYFRKVESNVITSEDDPISTGALVSKGSLVHLFKPYKEKFLPVVVGHSITEYIKNLKELSSAKNQH